MTDYTDIKDMNINQQKSSFRKRAKEIRAEIKGEEKHRFDAKICELVTSLSEFSRCSALLAYYPIGTEVDIFPIIDTARRLGKRVAFPVCKENGEMFFRYCDGDGCFVAGKYSIPVPSNVCEICVPDSSMVCIVPALALDSHGYRMGYGKGYYDRFLCAHNVKRISVIYDTLIFDDIPHDEYDAKIDIIITQGGVRENK